MSLRTLNVIKENYLGETVFCWEGELLASTPASRTLRALFVGEGAARVDKILFVPGDLMIERYYSDLSLIHISEPTRLLSISYAVFCLKKKKHKLKEAIR